MENVWPVILKLVFLTQSFQELLLLLLDSLMLLEICVSDAISLDVLPVLLMMSVIHALQAASDPILMDQPVLNVKSHSVLNAVKKKNV